MSTILWKPYHVGWFNHPMSNNKNLQTHLDKGDNGK